MLQNQRRLTTITNRPTNDRQTGRGRRHAYRPGLHPTTPYRVQHPPTPGYYSRTGPVTLLLSCPDHGINSLQTLLSPAPNPNAEKWHLNWCPKHILAPGNKRLSGSEDIYGYFGAMMSTVDQNSCFLVVSITFMSSTPPSRHCPRDIIPCTGPWHP